MPVPRPATSPTRSPNSAASLPASSSQTQQEVQPQWQVLQPQQAQPHQEVQPQQTTGSLLDKVKQNILDQIPPRHGSLKCFRRYPS